MAPRVTIGLPVRNSQQHVGRAIESVLAQDYSDFELVICDNCSDDSTAELVRGYAASDSRIKFHENGHDIGQLANMNRVFELGSGEYFRWIGDDDWLEPNYLSKCVEYLDRDKDIIAVSTYIKYFDDEGNEFYLEYTGERLESSEAQQRFSRMLWFSRADYRYSDAHYSLYRRSALQKTHLLRFTYRPDALLAAELSLVGPFGHIAECLSHRRRVPSGYDDIAAVYRRNNPGHEEDLRPSLSGLCANFNALVSAAPLSASQKAVCRYAIVRFFLARGPILFEAKARTVARRMPGYGKLKAALGR
jgi:glycosyltransferase involved in cell wall biosynthesis